MGFAALHHPLQHRPFAEVLEFLKTPFEFREALRVAFQEGAVAAASVLGSRCVWHYSSGKYTVIV